MTEPFRKKAQSQGKPHVNTVYRKPKGKRFSLKQYKADQRAALDKLLRECGG